MACCGVSAAEHVADVLYAEDCGVSSGECALFVYLGQYIIKSIVSQAIFFYPNHACMHQLFIFSNW